VVSAPCHALSPVAPGPASAPDPAGGAAGPAGAGGILVPGPGVLPLGPACCRGFITTVVLTTDRVESSVSKVGVPAQRAGSPGPPPASRRRHSTHHSTLSTQAELMRCVPGLPGGTAFHGRPHWRQPRLWSYVESSRRQQSRRPVWWVLLLAPAPALPQPSPRAALAAGRASAVVAAVATDAPRLPSHELCSVQQRQHRSVMTALLLSHGSARCLAAASLPQPCLDNTPRQHGCRPRLAPRLCHAPPWCAPPAPPHAPLALTAGAPRRLARSCQLAGDAARPGQLPLRGRAGGVGVRCHDPVPVHARRHDPGLHSLLLSAYIIR
jgi:hypothetical protein